VDSLADVAGEVSNGSITAQDTIVGEAHKAENGNEREDEKSSRTPTDRNSGSVTWQHGRNYSLSC